ncbi:hypothetical protein CEP14_02010 [Cylindrospermopsis raciborskii C04]|uniref:Outer membrane protein beta-barrel domain-containing protein n=1 Tax=Cylindrospermopsis raciborskii C07 TaxID=2014886 RepID=A0ABX4WQI1_9CYAN|nr:hypothetical protein [Cylindrospermopsis raciborskii]PNJ97403.1 hypothetical protein CEP13_03840 [Cylindrospermopsis raciborskii C03]PNJ99369.1 hypothetical protein CEP14_02010 [Cylindrospermopsis raciborskii C04]PNK00844.1 hypothetical protein CEP15_00760 [Cylindrospermopsis raciborskii C07]
MKCTQRLVSLLGIGLVFSLLMNQKPALAQVAYGSYVGVGSTVDTQNGQVGGILAFRYKLLEAPVSFRTQALIGKGTAVVPTVSYDVPINWQTDIYLGAGVVLTSGDTPSPVGNKISFALQPGIDYAIPNSSAVIFGNAIIAFDAYRNSSSTAVSVQGGVGLRF